jgi:hypothetical protein
MGLDLLYEVLSDRSAQDAHDRESVGVAFAAGWKGSPVGLPGSKETLPDRVYEYSFRIGRDRMDTPNIVESNGDVLQVESSHGFPDFTHSYFWGVEGEFQIPFGRTGYFVIDGGVFNGDADPDPWYLRLGITIPIEALYQPILHVGNQ